MTRVYARSNPDRIGTIVGEAPGDDVYVEWDGEEGRYRIALDRVGMVENSIQMQLLKAVDNFQDACILAIECLRRDIKREMKK